MHRKQLVWGDAAPWSVAVVPTTCLVTIAPSIEEAETVCIHLADWPTGPKHFVCQVFRKSHRAVDTPTRKCCPDRPEQSVIKPVLEAERRCVSPVASRISVAISPSIRFKISHPTERQPGWQGSNLWNAVHLRKLMEGFALDGLTLLFGLA